MGGCAARRGPQALSFCAFRSFYVFRRFFLGHICGSILSFEYSGENHCWAIALNFRIACTRNRSNNSELFYSRQRDCPATDKTELFTAAHPNWVPGRQPKSAKLVKLRSQNSTGRVFKPSEPATDVPVPVCSLWDEDSGCLTSC